MNIEEKISELRKELAEKTAEKQAAHQRILTIIRNNPEKWVRHAERYGKCDGIQNGKVVIENIGNSRLLSVCSVVINGETMILTYSDRWKIESVTIWWYRQCTLAHALV